MTSHSLKAAWDNIHANSFTPRINHAKDIQAWYTQRIFGSQHRPLHGSKRHNKGVAKGTGQILKRSHVRPQIHLEKYLGNSVKDERNG